MRIVKGNVQEERPALRNNSINCNKLVRHLQCQALRKLDKEGSILLCLIGLLQEIPNKQLYVRYIATNLHNRIVFLRLLVVERESRCWADVLLANDALQS